MRIIAFLAAMLLAGVAGAQNVMPVPSFSRTFSSAALTRGFYFQAPVDFTIVGLRVPDETNHGKQNVAAYVMPTRFPAWPSSGTGGLQFFKAGEPSSAIVACQVVVRTGEWVGVLGACGDSTMMHNSYGPTGAFQSNVLGTATTIQRLLTQTNLVTAQGTGAYSTEDPFEISRVEVYVQGGAQLVGSGTGAVGTTVTLFAISALDPGVAYQVGSALGNGPIPIGKRQLGLSVDALLVLSVGGALPMVFQDYSGYLDMAGKATARLNIPNAAALKGIKIYNAFMTLQASAPAGVASISNNFDFTIQ